MREEDIYKAINSKAKNNGLDKNESDFGDLTESEAMDIFHEIVDIYLNHNLSYKTACQISISVMYAFLTGAEELNQLDI